jgi:hypothetical protein
MGSAMWRFVEEGFAGSCNPKRGLGWGCTKCRTKQGRSRYVIENDHVVDSAVRMVASGWEQRLSDYRNRLAMGVRIEVVWFSPAR